MRGFKVTNRDMQCRNFQFELGVEFSAEGGIKANQNGFHFCEKLSSCFNYYDFNPLNRVFEVEGSGDFDKEDDKTAIRTIKFIRELTWHEVLDSVNTGENNTGRNNSGNRNSGHGNSGHGNSGDRNSGNYNSGSYNSTNYSTGFFNRKEQTVFMFDKDTGLKRDDVRLPYINLELNEWVTSSEMTNKEKEKNPNWETLGGYLKQIPHKKAWRKAWDSLNEEKRQKFLDLPNFDSEIFEEITGIKIN